MIYQVGQRVNIKKLGTATVLGFERFTKSGYGAPMSLVDEEGSEYRIICKLDDLSQWKGSEKHPDPYIMRYDIVSVI